MTSGFVSLIGRPNAGKSTLLNTIIGQKIAITSDKPQTTRNVIQGIYNEDDYQIIFVDCPGIHKANNKLGKTLNKQAISMMDDVDLIYFVIDGSEFLGPDEKAILENLKSKNIPVILVINKIDKMTDEEILSKINNYKDYFPFSEIVPISALKNDNLKRLIDVTKTYMKDEIRYFDTDSVTTNSRNFMLSEFVREKIMQKTDEEIPHTITCLTTKVNEKKDIFEIMIDIIVERDSIKKIIIGKRGSKLKEIGIEARSDMEKYLGKKVFLELYVKTDKKWRDKEKKLIEYGFKDFE